MIEVALLLNDLVEGLTTARVRLAALPRNSERISFNGRRYTVTDVTHLVGEIPVLVESPELAAQVASTPAVVAEVTAWRR